MDKCDKYNIKYSIHLPLYVFDWYNHDYLSAFFINKDKVLREKSFRLLKENLRKLQFKKVEYYVIHFPGVNHKDREFDEFEEVLEDSLDRVNQLAKQYNVKILLEYFGSNILFNDYNEWIIRIRKYFNLGILVDTGHLYFASKLVGFEFEESFNVLKKAAFAFHFWTVKGSEYYLNNEYYKKYHHIVPNLNQEKKDDWAFNTKDIFNQMIKENKPIIIEASNYYKGDIYYRESLKGLIEYNR
jgi:sugar phosphate isomerase/epimerase